MNKLTNWDMMNCVLTVRVYGRIITEYINRFRDGVNEAKKKMDTELKVA